MTDKNSEIKQEGDPAEFLLSNSKYHDCYLTVGNPEIDEVEKIGVSSTQLIAHSSVFRDMLADSKLADPSGSNTHIIDISPATFKLMLRHMYGGKLPKLTCEEAANLAMCADKYNIQRLVGKAAKQLNPTNAEDVFPAFMCVVYINCPGLELTVSKIIQQQTDRIMQNPKFLELDENCLLFLVKQNMLNISELELWKNLVRWGENQVKKCADKTLRNYLNKVLHHVRLLSLTSTEILEHVLPKKILTPDEFMDLSLAVSKKETFQSPDLCRVAERRGIYKAEPVNPHISDRKTEKKVPTLNYKNVYFSKRGFNNHALQQQESKACSTFTIKPLVNIKINTFKVKSIVSNPANSSSFSYFTYTFKITLYKSSNGHLIDSESMTMGGTAVPNENIILKVKKNNGESLILEAKETYNFKIQVTPPLPVYRLIDSNNDFTTSWSTPGSGHMKIKFEDPFHILKFAYKT